MHPAIRENKDFERGCGRRTDPGALYLVTDGEARSCGKLPLVLETCPCCGGGFKFSRTPVWLEQPERLWHGIPCENSQRRRSDTCTNCPMSNAYETGPALLLWIGEKFYPLTSDFLKEGMVMGISRRIQHVPRNFVVGETWVLLAHNKGKDCASILGGNKPDWKPAIFGMFCPTRVEVMVTGDESDEEIERYLERGLTPVLVWKPQPEAPAEDAGQQPLL